MTSSRICFFIGRAALLSKLCKNTLLLCSVFLVLFQNFYLQLLLTVQLFEILDLYSQHFYIFLFICIFNSFFLCEVLPLNQLILQIVIHFYQSIDVAFELPILLFEFLLILLICFYTSLSPRFGILCYSLIRLSLGPFMLEFFSMLRLQSNFQFLQ